MVEVFNKHHKSTLYEEAEGGIFMTRLPDVRQLELPVIATCEQFIRYDIKYVCVKHNPTTYSGSIILSTRYPQSQILLNNVLFEISVDQVRSIVRSEEYDSNERITVDVILSYDTNTNQISAIPYSLYTGNDFVSVILGHADTVKKYITWFLPILMGQSIIAATSYFQKGHAGWPWLQLYDYFLQRTSTNDTI